MLRFPRSVLRAALRRPAGARAFATESSSGSANAGGYVVRNEGLNFPLELTVGMVLGLWGGYLWKSWHWQYQKDVKDFYAAPENQPPQ